MDGSEFPLSPQNQQMNAELLKQQDDHQYDIALRAIEANITNKRELRTHLDNNNKRGMILTIVLSFFLLIFGLAALYLDKESILTDLLKILCGFLGGSGLGYAIGTRKRPPNA